MIPNAGRVSVAPASVSFVSKTELQYTFAGFRSFQSIRNSSGFPLTLNTRTITAFPSMLDFTDVAATPGTDREKSVGVTATAGIVRRTISG
jgi:hypothetical protein